ncbi:MAG TPA: hypothetical protein VNJ46_00075, partial [Gaiellaceae bacterium]|nr:hypothetical protein [Gaiellaceae bacterium]
ERGPVHVHGLGVNPADGALFVATHTGLFRAAPGERKAARVGDSRQDTMGFTVVGPDRFLGSGHPDARAALPPLLGLLESRDGGRTWRPVSLLGEADFHVLRYAGTRLYGYDVTGERLLVSRDHGRTWEERELPGPLLDLAVDPADPSRLLAVAAGPAGDGTYESRDGGRSWTYASEMVGLLAWPAPGRLYVADAGGVVSLSSDRGRTFERRGAVGGEPAALLAHSGELYAALHDGTIVRSRDGGRTWSVRSEP